MTDSNPIFLVNRSIYDTDLIVLSGEVTLTRGLETGVFRNIEIEYFN